MTDIPPFSFKYQNIFPLGKDDTEYYLLTKEGVSTSFFEGKEILKISKEALTLLANQCFHDCAFFLRPSHQKQVAAILKDPEASENDKYVALTMLRNSEVSAKGILPFCQDTGTATIVAKKGQQIWTGGGDEEALSKGIYETYTEENLRYSQNVPLDMYNEKNTGCNLPAQIDIQSVDGNEYIFLCIAKGGGSSNKTYLYQETKALLKPKTLENFLIEKMKLLGTSACPPYHITFIVGGTSADFCLKTAKLASAKYYDKLPTKGNEYGQAFRDLALEERILKVSKEIGVGAQFGGKYFAHDIRIIRLSRHGASCPIGMTVSCSADRNIKAKINKNGVWIEKLEEHPAQYIPEQYRNMGEGNVVKINLNRPMKEILADLTKYPVATRLSLNGTVIVGRDIAHAKLKELLNKGEDLPRYIKEHPIYYAGPAKTPKGMICGSMGPTTAGRMDPYVDLLQSHGGSMIMLAKGNRSQQITDSCQKYGGFYLGTIGGPAAILAQNNIKSIECLAYPELGMEAIWKIEVQNFPAFILVDDKGNDFFKQPK
ncbi:MAG: class I fumarate hydratase FumA [Candidatus Azobacteroides pseudotrichonymphae]|jgi:fumarate hydratase class I|uniref:Fumarate hydratase class I n=1 Tax=Azobacteroides pseudotrichonymphae genomovar. CFP2 TaxID=511995 RepID=B6YRA9_AZOPC|nr:fumarate hydratase [Candidatus Azobacteroides pseudotrichonymphae]MDR0530270.1 fumarate hydratase [Bacteroidales bacterium OttesenSCG-928-I14]BAG83731.1 fumarate hydratase [Candidatus Azobacteroides pseudotrichonymphae genomovar. CFP2]GMO34925.1 MAG: class I fumarate hydratase FumA [Candidatus Azobacteroides pseudotrichonymphae]